MNTTYKDILDQFFYAEVIKDYSLENIRKACEYFGNPQNSFQSIHIAGTNGKGSVSKMIFQILKESGKKVGVFTSPHLIDIRERFMTGNCESIQRQKPGLLHTSQGRKAYTGISSLISEGDFVQYAEKIIEYGGGLSYYERCTLLAFLYFRDVGCEYAIIEVGLGGRLDATNIITPVLSIITSISYDHMEFLGDTLEKIAFEKGGIIKPGIPIILYGKNDTLEGISHERGSPIIFPENREIKTNLHGIHQIANARIAHEAGRFLGISDTIIEHALLHVEHAGRLQYIQPNLVIDGAHNEDGIHKLKNYLDSPQFRHCEVGSDPVFLKKQSMDCFVPRNDRTHEWDEIIYCFSLKKGKSVSLVLDIFPDVQEWNTIDTIGFHLQDAQILAQDIQKLGKSARVRKSSEIILMASENPEKLFVVFGSLYMIGEFLSV